MLKLNKLTSNAFIVGSDTRVTDHFQKINMFVKFQYGFFLMKNTVLASVLI